MLNEHELRKTCPELRTTWFEYKKSHPGSHLSSFGAGFNIAKDWITRGLGTPVPESKPTPENILAEKIIVKYGRVKIVQFLLSLYLNTRQIDEPLDLGLLEYKLNIRPQELIDELVMEAECHEWTMEQLDREIWSS
jgi:hypothetical protein